MKFLSNITTLFIGLSFLVISIASHSDEGIRFSQTKIADGLYVLQGEGGFTGGNIAISVGDDGVVMIDDSMPPFLDKLEKAVSELAGRPIDFLINTHVHGDHTGNNASLGKGGAHIVAHENLRERLKTQGVDSPEGKQPTPVSALPVITFENEISFHLNGEKARVFHVEHAHTDGDAVIHFQQSNVLHTGDVLFNGMFPYIDLDNGGSVSGYIAAQKKLYQLANDQTIVVPGHGPITDRSALKASYKMLEKTRAIVKKLKDKGQSEDEVVKANPLKKFHDDWNWGFITTERMTRTLYKGL